MIHRAGAIVLLWLTPAFAAAELQGTVRDAATLSPIPAAIVRVQTTPHQTVTDGEGRYALPDAPGARIVAGAKGYFNAGQDAPSEGASLDFLLESVPHDPDAPLAFMAPSECGSCHQSHVDEWASSPMAHAGTNTWVLDLYSGQGTPGGEGGFVYTRDSVHASANPTSECASCHQPESWLEAPPAALRRVDDAHPGVERGVSCLTCHLVAHVDESKLSFPGFFADAALINRGGVPVRYGTLGDVDYFAPFRMRASYQPQLSSEVCAVCHEDSADPSGEGRFDGVVSEPTYGEWKASRYGDPDDPLFSSCMDCHSEPSSAPRASSLLTTPARPTGDVRTHTFEGTTPRFLDNAVQLELSATALGEELIVDATLINHATGHHVPTGVTMRNMILLVEASDVAGPLGHTGEQTVHALGGVGDPAQGYYAGLPGKLYGKLDRAADGSGPTFFTEAVAVDSDTRLAALATDHTRYTFQLREPGAVTVRAKVLYRRAWRAVVDAKGWTTDGHGRPLGDLTPPHFGHVMASAELRAQVPAQDEPLLPAQEAGCGCGGASAGPFVLLPLLSLLRRRRASRAAPVCSV